VVESGLRLKWTTHQLHLVMRSMMAGNISRNHLTSNDL
jgi:hypothetical protein